VPDEGGNTAKSSSSSSLTFHMEKEKKVGGEGPGLPKKKRDQKISGTVSNVAVVIFGGGTDILIWEKPRPLMGRPEWGKKRM